MPQPKSIRQLLEEGPLPLLIPGVFDAIGAKIAQETGFKAVSITGFGVAATYGRPDVGITTMTEMVDRARDICASVTVPVVADIDEGYGNPISVREAVRQFEHAGVAAVHIEDQQLPKKCGSMQGKKLVSSNEMVQKIRAAVEARSNPDLLIIARTDATATGDWDDAIARCVAYEKAGADVIMPMAPGTPEQMRRFTRAVDVPVAMIMGESEHWVRHNKLLPPATLHEIGFDLVLYPTSVLFSYVHAARRTLATIYREGSTESLLETMDSFQDVTTLLGLPEVYELEKRYAAS